MSLPSVTAEPVAEADVGRWEQNSESSPAGVHCGPGLTRLQLQVEVEQHETQELFDLVEGEVAAGTHGRPGPERHQVILQPLAVLEEARLAGIVLDVAVEPERLTGKREDRRSVLLKDELRIALAPLCGHTCGSS